MILVDAQLSPLLAAWLEKSMGVESRALRDIGFRDAEDRQIFDHARSINAIVMTKDQDFIDLLERFGPPPQVIWITCGNTSNEHLKQILTKQLPTAIAMISAGEPFVEITGE